MSLPETVMGNKKQSLLHRNSSQLLQHAAKFGLRRSVTTKVSTSPQQIQPRPSTSVSFSSSTNTNNKRYQQRKKQDDTVPYIDFTSKSITENILSSASNNNQLPPTTNNHNMSG
jgi:hypothetical protein